MERLQFAGSLTIAILGMHVLAEDRVRVAALDEHIPVLNLSVDEAPHLAVLGAAQYLR